jgi:hypothetical protein
LKRSRTIAVKDSDRPDTKATPDDKDTLPFSDKDVFYDALETLDDKDLYEWATPCWNVDSVCNK